MQSWDQFYLDLARFVAERRSKDPSTKVGAVIVRPDKTVVSMGFNGFARGLPDFPELYADRDFKIATVVHAEENAILTARERLRGCTIYVSSLPPCAHCASLIIQAGLARVVCYDLEIPERWAVNMDWSRRNLMSAGVMVSSIDPDTGAEVSGYASKWARTPIFAPTHTAVECC
jgi:dCMP deaminase